jgi:hypothetical protein
VSCVGNKNNFYISTLYLFIFSLLKLIISLLYAFLLFHLYIPHSHIYSTIQKTFLMNYSMGEREREKETFLCFPLALAKRQQQAKRESAASKKKEII